MNGRLSEHPFAELISEIGRRGFSGALRVSRDRVKGVLYFDGGQLIYATTNLRPQRLLEYVRKRAPESTIPGVAPGESDFALAAMLLARGVLSQETLNEIFAEQVADVLRVLLLWTEGEWGFDERARLTEPIRAAVPMQQLLIEAARRLDCDFTGTRLANPHERIYPGGELSDGLNLSPVEGFLLSRVEGPIEIGDLALVSGLSEPEAQRTIYGLALSGLLRREFWADAFPDQLKGTTKPEKSVAATASAPAPRKEKTVEAKPAPDPKQELNDLLKRLADATNHYEVLNVSTSADAAEIKRAYHGLARKFHPDRYHGIAGTSLHARLESAFARITQAHETLLNEDLKRTYDVKIAALKRVNSSFAQRPAKERVREPEASQTGPPKQANYFQLADKSFKEGVAALELGDTSAAISALTVAAKLRPDQPEYRAYLGSALARHEKTRHNAEAELLEAVRLDPNNASFHVKLATLYRDLGFSRRAHGALERALSLDSQNTEAREMMRNLK